MDIDLSSLKSPEGKEAFAFKLDAIVTGADAEPKAVASSLLTANQSLLASPTTGVITVASSPPPESTKMVLVPYVTGSIASFFSLKDKIEVVDMTDETDTDSGVSSKKPKTSSEDVKLLNDRATEQEQQQPTLSKTLPSLPSLSTLSLRASAIVVADKPAVPIVDRLVGYKSKRAVVPSDGTAGSSSHMLSAFSGTSASASGGSTKSETESVLKLVKPIVPKMVLRNPKRGLLDAFITRKDEIVDLTGGSVVEASGGSVLASIFKKPSKKPLVFSASASGTSASASGGSASASGGSASASGKSAVLLDAEEPLTLAGGVLQLRKMIIDRLVARGKTLPVARAIAEQFPSFVDGTLGEPAAFLSRATAAAAEVKLLPDYFDKTVLMTPVIGFAGSGELTAGMCKPHVVYAFKERVTDDPKRGQFGAAKVKGAHKPLAGRTTAFGTDKIALTGSCAEKMLGCLPPESPLLLAGSDVNLAVVPHSDTYKDPKTKSPFSASSATDGFVGCARVFNKFWDDEGVKVFALFSMDGAAAAIDAHKLDAEVFEFVLPVKTPAGDVDTAVVIAVKPSGEATLVSNWNHPRNWATGPAGGKVSGVMIVACLAGGVPIVEESVARMCEKSALGGDGRLNHTPDAQSKRTLVCVHKNDDGKRDCKCKDKDDCDCDGHGHEEASVSAGASPRFLHPTLSLNAHTTLP
jgi:hypothetical protein